MSKFDWRNGFAVGLILGIGITLIFAFAAIFSGIAPDDLSQPDTTTNESGQIQPQDNRWWLIPRVIYADDTAAQWVMTAATIFAAYLLLRTLWATQQMAVDTRQIGEAQVRAYLTFEGAKIGVHVDDYRVEWWVNVTARNSGNSPVRDAVGHVTSPLISGERLAYIRTIAGGGEVTGVFNFGTYDMDRLVFLDTDNTQVHIRVDVRVDYKDVFSQRTRNRSEVFVMTGVIELVDGETASLSIDQK